jgi:ABC-type multidrug transport system fused ATPase/permease subunit
MPVDPPADRRYEEFSHLGGGGTRDRLRFRLVLRILRRALPLLTREWRHLAAFLTAMALLVATLVIPTILLIDVFWTRVLQGEPLTQVEARFLQLDPEIFTLAESYGSPERKIALSRVVWFGLGITIPLIPIFLGLAYYQIWILQRINQNLRLQLLDRFQTLSLRFHADSRVGDTIYRMYQDSAMVTQLIDVLFLTPAQGIARFAFSLLIVGIFDPRLALLLALAWPMVLLLGAYYSQRLRVGFRHARETNSALTSRIQETLAGVRVLKAYGAELPAQRFFEHDSRAAFAAAHAARNRFAIFKVLTFLAVGSVLLLAVWRATLLTVESAPIFIAVLGFTVFNLGLYNNFKDRFGDGTNSVRRLMALWGRTQDIAIGLDRVFEVLDLEPEVQDAPDALAMPALTSSIAFRNVSFRYQRERPTLSGIDLEVGAGSISAIVGPTGSGKSTLMALLLRLFDPDEGSIEIDGVDLRRFQLESLRGNIAIALQENVLFGTSVRENIRYAVPAASDAQVREAARVACADQFIEGLPEGYDTLLGERGTKLSTGQRQRLSIARAVLKDTPILILDEPTASLDAETELRVLHNLAEWGKGRAIFLITHRLSTIRRADHVAFLRDGRIAEWGAHDELMVRDGGAYRSLVEAETGMARVSAAGDPS